MSLRQAKAIGELYTEVADYELVIVPEAPLGRALNRRLDRPHLGQFATTPRELAAGRVEFSESRSAFLHLIDETALDWRQAAYAAENILGCWEYEGSADGILQYDSYADQAVKTAIPELEGLDTTTKQLTAYEIDAATDVAVVAPDLYTPLELSIFPETYDSYSLFTDEAFSLPEFHVFDSPTGIVEALIDTITEANAHNIAILLDATSEYATVLEAALEAADLPFYGGPGFADTPSHRTFLQLLRESFRGANVRVKTLRPLIDRLGFSIDSTHDEKRLETLASPAASQLMEVFETIRESTFETALTEFENRCDVDCSAFRTELTRLGLRDRSVTPAAIEQLTFYLSSFDVPVERDNEGVLLADVNGSTFVDRPTVFCVGIDESWTQTAPNRPWVTTSELFDRHLKSFQLRLQNGTTQHYLVEDTRSGDPVTPCLYFDDLLDDDISRFTDFAHRRHSQLQGPPGEGFEHDPIEHDPPTVATFSQSSLNTYINSPRDYFFDKLLETPAQDSLTKGNLFHDFAELYANHPDRIDAGVIDEVVDFMITETAGFHRSTTLPLKRTEYRLGLETIAAYLDAHPPTASPQIEASDDGYPNQLANHFEWDLPDPRVEHNFENLAAGIAGTIDLIQRADRIIDYKSGGQTTAGSIVSNAAVEPPADKPDFQALLYLAYFRELNPDAESEFTFLYFLETVTAALEDTQDLADLETTVTYYPESFAEHVHSESMFEYLRDEGSNKCQKTLSQTTYEVYDEVLEAHTIPDTDDSEELIASPLGDAMEAALKDAVGDYKYVTQGTKQLFREWARRRSRNFFADDMAAFETFIDHHLSQLNDRIAGSERFPIEGPPGEPSYRRVDHRDLLIDNA